MSYQGNVAENWSFRKQRFVNYLIATELSKKDDKTKCAQLLTLMVDVETSENVEGLLKEFIYFRILGSICGLLDDTLRERLLAAS